MAGEGAETEGSGQLLGGKSSLLRQTDALYNVEVNNVHWVKNYFAGKENVGKTLEDQADERGISVAALCKEGLLGHERGDSSAARWGAVVAEVPAHRVEGAKGTRL